MELKADLKLWEVFIKGFGELRMTLSYRLFLHRSLRVTDDFELGDAFRMDFASYGKGF